MNPGVQYLQISRQTLKLSYTQVCNIVLLNATFKVFLIMITSLSEIFPNVITCGSVTGGGADSSQHYVRCTLTQASYGWIYSFHLQVTDP